MREKPRLGKCWPAVGQRAGGVAMTSGSCQLAMPCQYTQMIRNASIGNAVLRPTYDEEPGVGRRLVWW